MKIGIDIDDVVEDFVTPFLKFFNEQTGEQRSYQDVTSYEFEPSIFEAFCASPQFEQLPEVDGAAHALRELSREHDLVFITSRYGIAKERSRTAIDRYAPRAQIIFAGEYQPDLTQRITKAEICLREGVDLIIEDSGGYALECAEKGIPAYLLNRPWNMHVQHPLIERVNGWSEIIESLKSGKYR